MDETIFAQASGAGRAGIAVFRLSGPLAGPALRALGDRPLPVPRRATRVRLSWNGEPIDDGLALWFPAPASFTGEDVAELHLHGGPAVARALVAALAGLGLRPAEPGEFTRRAFEAGKMDLTQAEAIADLVAAETAAQRRQALRQMDGALGRLYDGWRARLLAAQAELEAAIDFSDQDLGDDPAAGVPDALADLEREMTAHLDDQGRGERLRDGAWVALVGAVNAGKSSLLNRLAGREAAIVAASAGTTRDIVEVRLEIGGVPVTLADTAGLRAEGAGPVEQEGIRRARERAEQADLRLVVVDGERWPDLDDESRALLGGGRALAVVNKGDRLAGMVPAVIEGCPALVVSALTGAGLDDLVERIAARVGADSVASAPPLTRARHRAAVEEAVRALRRARNAALPELVAEDVRVAAHRIGRITGRIDVEDVLDAVFRDFCIGK